MKKSSYKTNSWWNHRMVGCSGPIDKNIDTFEDKKQDAYLKKLEESKKPSRKKISKPLKAPRKNFLE